jgi:signal transduction histidine kinase
MTGIGFDPNGSRDHDSLGLTSMHERAALVGGMFSIESGAGNGTTILIRIPLSGAV